MLGTASYPAAGRVGMAHTHHRGYLVLEEGHVRSEGGELGQAHRVFWVHLLVQSASLTNGHLHALAPGS